MVVRTIRQRTLAYTPSNSQLKLAFGSRRVCMHATYACRVCGRVDARAQVTNSEKIECS